MTYKECKQYINSDYYRNHGKTTNSILRLWFATLLDVGYRYLFWFRLSAMNGIAGYFPRLILMVMRQNHGIDIPHGTQIGYGCKLAHGCQVVINSSAVIGNNVDILLVVR